MARRGIKKRDYEKLDDLTISRIVLLLEHEKPITKKAACEILNINYNTLRLNKIIEEYKDKISYAAGRRKQNKGRAFDMGEIQEAVLSYLKGFSIAQISKNLFRPTYAIKKLLKELGIPERSKNASYQNPDMIAEESVSEEFEIGEYVWSARYNSVAQIDKERGNICSEYNIYRIWVYGRHMQYAYQPAYELGKLLVLKTFNLREDEFDTGALNYDFRIE